MPEVLDKYGQRLAADCGKSCLRFRPWDQVYEAVIKELLSELVEPSAQAGRAPSQGQGEKFLGQNEQHGTVIDDPFGIVIAAYGSWKPGCSGWPVDRDAGSNWPPYSFCSVSSYGSTTCTGG
jgi:hypothetical protein